MTYRWCYKVVKVVPIDGTPYYTIREAHYLPDGLVYTDNITPIGNSKKDLIEVLETMLKDAKYYNAVTLEEEVK